MAKGYHIYKINSLSDFGGKDSLSVPSQLTYLQTIEVPDTSITVTHPDYHAGFTLWKVHHEMLVSMTGRVQNITFNEFVRPFDFNGFVHKDLGFIAFQGKGYVVGDAVRTMNERLDGFHLQRLKLDLKKLLPYVTYLKGAWFKINNPNLASQALFGDHVDQDPTFDTALKMGQSMSNIMLNYEFNNSIFLSTVLDECGVIFYQNILPEIELELVMDMKCSLLDLAVIDDSAASSDTPKLTPYPDFEH